MQNPYTDSTGQLTFKVDLKNAADVFLVDSNNYRNYNSGQKYEYFGGNYTQTPVTISVQGTVRWYLIVQGEGQYQYRFY